MDTPSTSATTTSDTPPAAAATSSNVTRSSRAVPLSFGAILVCFFFSFVNITCQGQRVASLTGIQLAKGTTVESTDLFGSKETKKVDAEPLATFALIAAIAGLLLSFGRRTTRVLTTIAGAAGAVLLLMMKSKIDGNVLKQGQGLMQVEYGAAFTIAVLLFIVAALLSSGFLDRFLKTEPGQ